MARDSATPQKTANKPKTQVGHHSQPSTPKLVHFQPFKLFSQDDESLKKASSHCEKSGLNRHKLCVVTIITKDALNSQSKDILVNSIFATGETIKRQKSKSHQRPAKSSEKYGTSSQSTSRAMAETISKINICDKYENQVVGQIDSKSGVIVLNLTSYLEIDQLKSLIEEELILQPGVPILSQSWSKWNQNLVKTMLILMLVSHIVVFYNPEPSIDFNLFQLIRVIELLRLKSQSRVTDLLESIAAKHNFSSSWIRQARVACPRALFACDLGHLESDISYSDITSAKRELEDHTYKISKRMGLIDRGQSGIESTAPLSLPEDGDFIFFLTEADSRPIRARRSIKSSVPEHQKVPEDFYQKIFRLLSLGGDTDESSQDRLQTEMVQDSDESDNSNELGRSDSRLIDSPTDQKDKKLTVNQSKFKKFINKHIYEFQSKGNNESKGQIVSQRTQIILPRYDDFFAVILGLKQLFFPEQKTSCETSESKPTRLDHEQQQTSWLVPDERRFVDIYNYFNTDDLFSINYCRKIRMSAYEYYLSYYHNNNKPNSSDIDNHIQAACLLYTKHARGTSTRDNLTLLYEQCQKHKDSIVIQQKPSNPKQKGKGLTNLSRIPSLDSPASTSSSSKSSFSIQRRANGIRLAATCDCGKLSNFMITPTDKRKKLDRVDITKSND